MGKGYISLDQWNKTRCPERVEMNWLVSKWCWNKGLIIGERKDKIRAHLALYTKLIPDRLKEPNVISKTKNVSLKQYKRLFFISICGRSF